MKELNINTRLFSLSSADFFSKNINDLVYATIQSQTYFHPIERITYLTLPQMIEIKKYLQKKLNKSRKTIDNNINKLFSVGLITETEIKINGNKTKIYKTQNRSENYFDYIKMSVLKDLLNLNIRYSIQIYLYLLNKFKNFNEYNFTLAEISKSLGWSETTRTTNYKKIKEVLFELERNGIIETEKIYLQKFDRSGTAYKEQRIILKNIKI